MNSTVGNDIKYKVLLYFKSLDKDGLGYVQSKAKVIKAIPDDKGLQALKLVHVLVGHKIVDDMLQPASKQYLLNNNLIIDRGGYYEINY